MSGSRVPSAGNPLPHRVICPYLGIEEDPQTCLGYPSHWNFCHRAKPAAAVSTSHQCRVCFSSDHTKCPVATSEKLEPLPMGLRSRQTPYRRWKLRMPTP